MLTAFFHRRPLAIRQFAFCLLLCALVLRALVPAGFMPDVGALRDGRLEMTLCTAVSDSAKSIVVDFHDSSTLPAHDDDRAHATTDCPFGFLTSLAAPPTIGFALAGLPLSAWVIRLTPRRSTLVTMPVPGAPLGSRAPPLS